MMMTMVLLISDSDNAAAAAAQPPTVACKMDGQSEIRTRRVHVFFLHVWRRLAVLGRCLSTKNFLIGAQSEVYRGCAFVGWASNDATKQMVLSLFS